MALNFIAAEYPISGATVLTTFVPDGQALLSRKMFKIPGLQTDLERCSPAGTEARAMQTTSEDMSFRSVYSFSWPLCQGKGK